LRDRVAQQLGPIVTYRDGRAVGPTVVAWFQQRDKELRAQGKPGLVAEWANLHPAVAQAWVKANDDNKAYVADWMKVHTEAVAKWKEDPNNQGEPKAEDLAVPFFESFAGEHPGAFPSLVTPEGQTKKRIE